MISVMLVEDEPSAMKYLTTLVETRCTGFQVVCKAQDGAEAVELLREVRPEVVITDIQMAQMSGIELAEIIKREEPGVCTVIVSGHSDFAYAKSAISSGVVEYLLKPVVPSEFIGVMEKLKAKIYSNRLGARRQILSQILAKLSVDEARLRKNFPHSHYWLAVTRSCGLPSRFMPPAPLTEGDSKLTIVYGRNDLEFCAVYPSLCHKDAFVAMLPRTGENITALVAENVDPKGFSRLTAMLDELDKLVVPGLSRVIDYPADLREQDYQGEQPILTRLQYALSNAMLDEIKAQYVNLFALWEKMDCRLIHVKEILLFTVHALYDVAPPGHGVTRSEADSLVTTACLSSVSFSDLLGQIWQIVEKLMLMQTSRNDSAQLHNKIVEYIGNHISEPMSTQTICNLFGISPTYLSRLFRKHSQITFNEFVTLSRVEEAKRMIELCPEMPLRDIAQKIGFSDQFYFSKVFRSVVGIPPSEYRK